MSLTWNFYRRLSQHENIIFSNVKMWGFASLSPFHADTVRDVDVGRGYVQSKYWGMKVCSPTHFHKIVLISQSGPRGAAPWCEDCVPAGNLHRNGAALHQYPLGYLNFDIETMMVKKCLSCLFIYCQALSFRHQIDLETMCLKTYKMVCYYVKPLEGTFKSLLLRSLYFT